MAQVDVTELMMDPDFVDTIQVIARVPSVDSFGQGSTVDTIVQTVGSVQPASGKTIQRLPEALRVANVSSFWCKTPMISLYPSVLVFKGRRFQVQTIQDWSNFGQGYSEGTCVAEKPA